MSYSRLGYLAIGVESTENTAVTPTVFVPLMSEDIVTEWGAQPIMSVAGTRVLNRGDVSTAIPAPTGTITVQVEPQTIGHFLRGVFGAVTTGRWMPVTGVSGDWAVGNTVTGGTSSQTATLAAISGENDYFLVTSPSGAFTAAGETITNGSTGTASLTEYDASVYGHQFSAPQSSLPTYTIEIGLENEAYRYTGVRFNGITINQVDNVITAQITITARAEFKHARVTAVTTSGAGSQTITVDQTTGLVASDSIRLYRPGTGFLDFSAASTTTHSIDAVSSETAFTVTALETTTAVGDLIVLNVQTPSYTQDVEFTWIGGSQAYVDDTITASITGSVDSIEDFELSVVNEIEPKHAADGVNVVNRFPDTNFLKGLTGSGRLTRTYTDMSYLDRLRNNTNTAVRVRHTGSQISSTTIEYLLDWRAPNVLFDPFSASIAEDDLLGQDMGFQLFNSTTDGYFARAVLVNTTTSY